MLDAARPSTPGCSTSSADAAGLPLTDLALQAGWDVEPPGGRDADGSIRDHRHARSSARPSQFSEVMDELTGEGGPHSAASELVRTKGFARVDYRGDRHPRHQRRARQLRRRRARGGTRSFDGPTSPIPLRGDPRTIVGLTRRPVAAGGRGRARTAERRGRGLIDGRSRRATWAGRRSPTPTSCRSGARVVSTREVSALVLRGVAVVAGVLAALVAFAQVLRVLLPGPSAARRSTADQPFAHRSCRPHPAPSGQLVAPVTGEARRRSNVDGARSLRRPRGPQGDRPRRDGGALPASPTRGHSGQLLVPFARERASTTATDEEIAARARAARAWDGSPPGSCGPRSGWRARPMTLDSAYVALHSS